MDKVDKRHSQIYQKFKNIISYFFGWGIEIQASRRPVVSLPSAAPAWVGSAKPPFECDFFTHRLYSGYGELADLGRLEG